MYVKACDLGKHACALCFKSAVGGLSLGLGVFSRPLLLQTASFLQDTCPRGIAATSPTPEGVPLSSAGTVLLTGQPESPWHMTCQLLSMWISWSCGQRALSKVTDTAGRWGKGKQLKPAWPVCPWKCDQLPAVWTDTGRLAETWLSHNNCKGQYASLFHSSPHLLAKITDQGWVWWCTSVIPAPRRKRRDNCKTEASLYYPQWDFVFKKCLAQTRLLFLRQGVLWLLQALGPCAHDITIFPEKPHPGVLGLGCVVNTQRQQIEVRVVETVLAQYANQRQKARWGELGQSLQEEGAIVWAAYLLCYSTQNLGISIKAGWKTASILQLIVLCKFLRQS